MTYKESLIETTERLIAVKDAENSQIKSADVAALTESLRKAASPLESVALIEKVFSRNGVTATTGVKTNVLLRMLLEIKEAIDENRTVDEIKNSNSWKNLPETLKNLVKTITERQAANWQSYFSTHFNSLESPEEIESSVIPSGETSIRLERYKSLYKFIFSHKEIPPTSETRLAELSNSFAEAAKMHFDRDMTEELYAFFNAVKNNVATLKFLTPGVLSYLEDTNKLEDYLIKKRF